MKDKIALQDKAAEKVRNTSMVRACFNLTKSAVGVGTLYLPGTVAKLGWAFGLALMVVLSLLSATSHHFLARLAANTDIGDFFGLGKLAYGSVGEMTAVAATLLYLFGALIAYCKFAGAYISDALLYLIGLDEKVYWYLAPSYMTLMVSAILIFPLACLKDLSKLANMSILGMICIGYITVLTVVDYFVHDTGSAPPVTSPFLFSTDIFGAISDLVFAFANHFTTVALVPVLIRPTPARRHQLIAISQIATTLIYMIVALFGYFHFGDALKGNDILNARKYNAAYAAGKLAIGATVILSFPLLLDPTRSALDHLLTRGTKGPSAVRHYGVTAALVSVSAIIASQFAKHVQGILNVFSSFAGSLLMFVFPALYFLRMQYKYPVHATERTIAWVDIIVGAVMAVVGTTVCAMALFKEEKASA